MTAAALPDIGAGDRLSLTLCVAIILHALVLLGVSFESRMTMPPQFDAMEVILVQQRTPDLDEDVQALAQVNLQSSGATEADVRPTTPITVPTPVTEPEPVLPPADTPPTPEPKPDVPAEAAPPQVAAEVAEPTPPQPEKPLPEPELLTTIAPEPEPIPQPKSEPLETAVPEEPDTADAAVSQPARSRPTASELVASSFAIAALNAEIEQRMVARSRRPRRKYVTASTREYEFAAYMEAWRSKVERVGNINYPEAARQRNLSGSLVLEVQVNPDGSVRKMVVRRSSGHQVLDDAAKRIVAMAAPYPAFPSNIRDKVDILHITRTWQFQNDGGFSGR